MKNIPSSNPLETYGVNILTGEACAFGMRLLCDLNEQGVALMAEYLGIPNDPLQAFAPNWNRLVNGEPAVASIMLARDIFPHLIRFALFREGYRYVVQHEDSWALSAFNDNDAVANTYLNRYLDGTAEGIQGGKVRLHRNWKSPSQPSVGSRNVHAFTGRAA